MTTICKKAIMPKQPNKLIMDYIIDKIQAKEGHSYTLVRIEPFPDLLKKGKSPRVKRLPIKACKTLISTKTNSTPESIYFAQVCSAGIMILHLKEEFVFECKKIGTLTTEQFIGLLSDAMICYFGVKDIPHDANHMVTKTIETNIRTRQHDWRLVKVKTSNKYYLMAAGLVPVIESNLITSGVYTLDKNSKNEQ